jgi:hypothetical protein
MGSLTHWEKSFNSVGWFIPPYIQMDVLSRIAAEIHARSGQFEQDELEKSYAPAGGAVVTPSR